MSLPLYTSLVPYTASDISVPSALAAWASSNITAGSDTTGILLRSIFYYLLSNQASLVRLRAELFAASDALGPMASWRQARELPYLDAVIKEAGRLNPSFGLPYERVVPAGGATICGSFLPEGTVVGMSAFVVHHDREVFGEDCDHWRPERWLDASEEQRRKMENSLLTVSLQIEVRINQMLIGIPKFGAGHRSCLGKNIAYLEVYKVVPTLLYHFDVSVHKYQTVFNGSNVVSTSSIYLARRKAVDGVLTTAGWQCLKA